MNIRAITLADLQKAADLADTIQALETAKDEARDTKHAFRIGMERIDVPVSAQAVREEIIRRITAATAELHAMGFELAPPSPSTIITGAAVTAFGSGPIHRVGERYEG